MESDSLLQECSYPKRKNSPGIDLDFIAKQCAKFRTFDVLLIHLEATSSMRRAS